MKSLSIVFAGTPEFGLPCLEALHDSVHHIKAVYSQPDRPAGRGRKLQASPIKAWALDHNLPVYQPLNFKTPEALNELESLEPDVLIVIAYGIILPKAVLDIPKLGCINVHASLLPRWRGASPIQQAILHGDAQSGVTIMKMDVGLDTGAMYLKASCPISNLDTAGSLHDTLANLSPKPLLNTLDQLAAGQAVLEEQNNNHSTYAGKINKEDAQIRWELPAQELDRQIRAYNPWPISHMTINAEVIRIHQAQAIDLNCTETPGTILQMDKKGILIATGDKALLVQRIQLPGGRAISVADWLNAGKTHLYVGFCCNEK